MHNFAPLSATLGGLIIGLATTILWVVNGRTAGISNIVGAVYPPRRGDVVWRLVFLVGLPLGAWLGFIVAPRVLPGVAAAPPNITLSSAWLIGTGLLVGVGTRLGRGCTSGHGICGLSRLSLRSIVAVATFMAVAMITVFIQRHVIP